MPISRGKKKKKKEEALEMEIRFVHGIRKELRGTKPQRLHEITQL